MLKKFGPAGGNGIAAPMCIATCGGNMEGGGAAPPIPVPTSGRGACGLPHISLQRCPRTINLCCSASTARSAAARASNVTNAQWRAPMTLMERISPYP